MEKANASERLCLCVTALLLLVLWLSSDARHMCTRVLRPALQSTDARSLTQQTRNPVTSITTGRC
jgi:hypothetical protein